MKGYRKRKMNQRLTFPSLKFSLPSLFKREDVIEILLTPLSLNDAEIIFETIDKERHYLREWLPFIDYTKDIQDTYTYISDILETSCPVFKILYDGHFAGMIGFKDHDSFNHRAEIGYWLRKDFQNKGIMKTCLNILLDFGYTYLNLYRIQIRVAVDNIKSKKLPEKYGFICEGVERSGELLSSGSYTDLNVYSLLKDEFFKVKGNS